MMAPAHPADTLAAVMMQENAALAVLDLVAATGLLDAKSAALAGLAGMAAPSRDAAGRLVALAAENRRLLERAILVQGRVIGAIARAAPRAMAGQGSPYGRTGAPARRALPAMALSARA